jgi:hypothetical protein
MLDHATTAVRQDTRTNPSPAAGAPVAELLVSMPQEVRTR